MFATRGLPPPFRVRIVDTKVLRTHWSEPARIGRAELVRTIRILKGVRDSVRSDEVAVMHLSCAISQSGVFRDWAAVRITANAGVPLVVQLHGLFAAPTGASPLAVLRRAAYRGMFSRAAAILVLNRESAAAVASLGPYAGRTQLVPAVVDFSRYPERRLRGEGAGSLRAVFVGANIEAKGVFRVVEIARSVERLDLRLVGAISPAVRSRIEGLVQHWDLGPRVRIEGEVAHDRVLSILAESDVLLFPTTFPEGAPVAVAEAMAMGLPVVSSPIGAIPDMVEEGRGGRIIPAENLDEYATALCGLRDDPALRERMGAFNREKASSSYHYAIVARQMADLYLWILRRQRAPAP